MKENTKQLKTHAKSKVIFVESRGRKILASGKWSTALQSPRRKKQRSESVMEKEQRLHAYGYHPEIKFKLPVDNKIEAHTWGNDHTYPLQILILKNPNSFQMNEYTAIPQYTTIPPELYKIRIELLFSNVPVPLFQSFIRNSNSNQWHRCWSIQ